jgi:glycosyltransferase involved in cell wall biosynthesis
MHVIVDGIIYARQRYGGINTYFNEVLPRIAREDHTRVDLLLPRERQGTAPGPPVRLLARDFIPPRTGLSYRLDTKLEPILEALKLVIFGLWARTKAKVVFQSTYFTSLPVSVPHVAVAHDMNHELFPEYYANPAGIWLRRRYPEYLGTATRVIAVSETTKRHVVQYYGLDPDVIDVIHHAVDPGTFYVDRQRCHLDMLTSSLGIRLPYVLYVGGRWSYKNFDTVLAAMADCYRRTGLTLVVVGPPWGERESVAIAAHGAGPAVELVPYPDDELLRVLYNFATAFVFPSLNEGFGIPLLEAMACGTPVVASETPVFHEVAGDAALYFDPHSSADLVRGIEQCLETRTRSELRDRGLARLSRYSWDTAAAQTCATYRKALGGSAHSCSLAK